MDHPGRLMLRLLFALAISGIGRFAYAGNVGDGVDQPAAKAALLKAYPGLFTKCPDLDRRHHHGVERRQGARRRRVA